MTENERIALLRHAAEMTGMLLDNPTPENLTRCQRLLSSALVETMPPQPDVMDLLKLTGFEKHCRREAG